MIDTAQMEDFTARVAETPVCTGTDRQAFARGLMLLTGLDPDGMAGRVAVRAAQLRIADLTPAKVHDFLNGKIRLLQCEWRVLVEVMASQAKAALREETLRRPKPFGLSSILNREEKRERERRAVVLGACIALSGLSPAEIAGRIMRHCQEFESQNSLEKTISAVISKEARLSDTQWSAIARVVIAAAVQGLDREEKDIEAAAVSALDESERIERDTRLLRAAMRIGNLSADTLARQAASLARSFGVESLSDGVRQKVGDAIAGKCLLGEVERTCLMRPSLAAALTAIDGETESGGSSPARYAEIISGALEIGEIELQAAAAMVSRLASRWFMPDRLITGAAKTLADIIAKPESVELTPDERRIVSQAVLSYPAKLIRQELESCR